MRKSEPLTQKSAQVLYNRGGYDAVIARAEAIKHPAWGRCGACEAQVPVNDKTCLVCGQSVQGLSIPLKTLADFKRALATHHHWEIRWNHRPDVWQPRVVAKLQSNAIAFAKSREPDVVRLATERPQANATWHWWGKASHYKPSPDCDGALRILIGERWDDAHAGWMEYRPIAEEG